MSYWEIQNIYTSCITNVALGLVVLLEVKVLKWLFDGDNGRWLINLFRGRKR